MRKEASGYRVVPQVPGTAEDLKRVVAIGFQRKKQEITRLNIAKAEVLKTSSSGVDRLRNAIGKLGLTGSEEEEALAITTSSSLRMELAAWNLPRIQQETPSDINEVISDEEKKYLLRDSVMGMTMFGDRHGVNVPSNITDRLFILSEDIFNYVIMANEGIDHDLDPISIGGTTMLNRIAVVNNDRVSMWAKEKVVDYGSLFREVCVHELWHSLSYKEQWMSNDVQEPQFLNGNDVRRSGLTTARPGKATDREFRDHQAKCFTLHLLEEGFTQYMTAVSLREIGEDTHYNAYPTETGVISGLVNDIGIGHFIRANFTKKGFAGLISSLTELYQQRIGSRPTYNQTLWLIGRELRT